MPLMFDEIANLWMRRASLGRMVAEIDARRFQECAGMSVMDSALLCARHCGE
jgi:hypothetical protein